MNDWKNSTPIDLAFFQLIVQIQMAASAAIFVCFFAAGDQPGIPG
jgi:hypothetical protein